MLRLKALLGAGININAKIDPKSLDLLQYDKKGFSLLHLAVMHCKKQMVDVLLASNQANLQLVDKDGLSALHMVASYRDDTQQVLQSEAMLNEKQIAEAIIKHSNAIDLRDKAGNTALHKAAINGNVYVVELLLKKDYLFPQQKLLSIKNKHGNTVLLPLHKKNNVLTAGGFFNAQFCKENKRILGCDSSRRNFCIK